MLAPVYLRFHHYVHILMFILSITFYLVILIYILADFVTLLKLFLHGFFLPVGCPLA